MTLQFGLRVPTVGTPADTAAYAAGVEAAGFDFMWVPDTPLLAGRWRDVYMHLGAAAGSTDRMRLGPGVTNPLTRHPLTTASAIATLDDASGGRADLVAGTGYSSAYIIGRRAATLADMREATALWRGLLSGAPTDPGGSETIIDRPNADLPIVLAATGPRMLALAGEIADGVLIHVGAAPGAVAWALERIDAGMAAAGRAREEVRRIVVVTACIDDDRERAIEHMRPCAAGLCVTAMRKSFSPVSGYRPGRRTMSSHTRTSAMPSIGKRRSVRPPMCRTTPSRPASRSVPPMRLPTGCGRWRRWTSTRSGGGTRPPGPGRTH